MISIGVTNENHIPILKQICEDAEITYISSENDANIFDIVVLSEKDKIQVCNTISEETFLIINSDDISALDIMCKQKIYIVTYGLNSKATLTVSSLDEEQMVLCLQRTIIDINNNEVEPQEFSILKSNKFEDNQIMAIVATSIVCGHSTKKLSSFVF